MSDYHQHVDVGLRGERVQHKVGCEWSQLNKRFRKCYEHFKHFANLSLFHHTSVNEMGVMRF